jgi:hypothetical protein
MQWNFWEQANYFERNGTLVSAIAANFGISESQLDDLFIAAGAVTV